MSQVREAKSDARVKRLCRLVDEALVALGYGFKPIRLTEFRETTQIDFPIPFFDHHVHGTTNELSEVVLETLTQQLRFVRKWLLDRSADIEAGLSVVGAFDMAGRPGWNVTMPRWGVAVRWKGPKPDFWPHPVTAKDFQKPSDSEIPSDYEFKHLYGEDPTALYKRLRDKRSKERN